MPTNRKKTTVPQPRTRAKRRSGNPSLTAPDIAGRAYELFLQRGAAHGRDWDDWLQAERELLSPSAD